MKQHTLKEKMNWTMEDFKNSEDIVDRTVWFIATLSPHNLWKGYEAIDNLVASEKRGYAEEIIGEEVYPEDFKCNGCGDCEACFDYVKSNGDLRNKIIKEFLAKLHTQKEVK